MSTLEENSTHAVQLPGIGNISVKKEERHYFRSYADIGNGIQNIPVKNKNNSKIISASSGDSADKEFVGAKLRGDQFCYWENIPLSSVFFCDICGAYLVERAIKLNRQERATAKVILKVFSRLNQTKITPKTIPDRSCNGCFKQITLFSSRLKGKLAKYKPKRHQIMNSHGAHCTCLNCYNPCSESWNPSQLQTTDIQQSQNISGLNPNPDLDTYLSSSEKQALPYGPQEQSMQPEISSFGYQLPYIPNDAPGYSPQLQAAHGSQQHEGLYSSLQSFMNYPSGNLDASESSLPVPVEHYVTENLEDRDQPSTSRGFSSHLEDEPNSKKIRKVCEHCSKEFTHTGDFKKHLRTHTKERPFMCLQCQKTFSHSSNLRRHQRSHLNDRPYKCEHCHKEFNRRDKLVSHKKSKACKNKRYEGKK